MGFFEDLGKIAREVRNIGDDLAQARDEMVSSGKEIVNQAKSTETVVKEGAKSTISDGKKGAEIKVQETKEAVKKQFEEE